MGPSWDNKQALQLQVRALKLLAHIVEEIHDSPNKDGPVETGLIYRHANNIVWLATDILTLVTEGCIAGPPILARAMLESLFCLGAATSVPNFAPRKAVSELREHLSRLQNLGLNEGSLRELPFELEKAIKRIQDEYNLDRNDKHWSVTRCARESVIADFLRTDYFMLSQHAHATSIGLMTRHSGVDTGLVHKGIITSLIMGTAFAAQLLPVATPQRYVDDATKMLGELRSLDSQGIFLPKKSE